MKKVLLVALLAVCLVALLTSPAFAGKTVPTSRPPVGVPILVPGSNNMWFEYSQIGSDGSQFYHEYDAYDSSATNYKAVPKNVSMLVSTGWLGAIYGQVKDVPKKATWTLDITGPNGYTAHYSPAQTAPYWTGPFQWDSWWAAFPWGPGPASDWPLINPSIGAGEYLNWWYMPVGTFAPGSYELVMTNVQLLPTVDLINYSGTGKPTHETPGPIGTFTYDFTVQ
jgi:hypothetical protein